MFNWSSFLAREQPPQPVLKPTPEQLEEWGVCPTCGRMACACASEADPPGREDIADDVGEDGPADGDPVAGT